MNNGRLGYIDLIKGFGIILVVLGHAMIPRSPWIYSFHVPLFFFISGLVFKDKPLTVNLRSRLIRIYFPFIIFNVLTWIFFFLLEVIKKSPVDRSSYINLFRTIVGFDCSVPQNGPLWFLLCLFTVSVIYSLLSLLKSEYIRSAAVLLIFGAGYLLSQRFTDLPFKLETAMTMVLFFHVGKLADKFDISAMIEKMPFIMIFNLSFALSLIHYFVNVLNINYSGIERISVLENRYGNVLLFLISALSAISFIFILSKKIGKIRAVNFLGKNSLLILCVHYPILQYTERIHPAFLSGSLLFDLLSSLIAIILSVVFIYCVRKVFHLILRV